MQRPIGLLVLLLSFGCGAPSAAPPLDLAGTLDAGSMDAATPSPDGTIRLATCTPATERSRDRIPFRVSTSGAATSVLYTDGHVASVGDNAQAQLGDGLVSHVACASCSYAG